MESRDPPEPNNTCEPTVACARKSNGPGRRASIFPSGQITLQYQESIIESLARYGVSASVDEADISTGFGIVIFEGVDDGLLDLARSLNGNGSNRVIGISLASSLKSKSWALLEYGFSDVVTWQGADDTARNIAVRLERWNDVERLLESSLVKDNLIGRSVAWKTLLRRVIEVACFTDASVLILGESGTGKELVARLLHTLDPREPKHDLVIADCTTIAPELSGSEFFGHERGAFTGAMGPREGAFALADGGSLFLDEVGELPLHLQPQLLRVVQERSYKRIGGNKWHKTNFRLICATNRDLNHEVQAGRFRADLYYRIASWVFRLPPLHDRPEDILPLTRHFLAELNSAYKSIELDDPVQQYLLNREYPGNIRELRQLVLRIGQRHVGTGPITIGDVPEDERPRDEYELRDWRDARFQQAIRRALAMGIDLKEIGQHTKDTAIAIAVEDEDGNLQRAARRLGVTDRTLQMHRANNPRFH